LRLALLRLALAGAGHTAAQDVLGGADGGAQPRADRGGTPDQGGLRVKGVTALRASSR